VSTATYTATVGAAMDRLTGIGFEHGPSFVNHAPMAAEALASLGLCDGVPQWLERNLRTRRYHDVPAARWTLSPDDEGDWRAALGDFNRVADWSAMFERLLADRPWRHVLADWWPRLLPGVSGALTHGVIRTAHATRALAVTGTDEEPLRRELARGLGYWAARYSWTVTSEPSNAAPENEQDQWDEGQVRSTVQEKLNAVVADAADFYTRHCGRYAIPLVHAVTAPAAIQLMCEYLPVDQQQPSYAAAKRCSSQIRAYFGTAEPTAAKASFLVDILSPIQLIADAAALGDEHAIKITEVALRHNATLPDDRLLLAARTAIREIARSSA
jgi:hypothetical protein